MREFEKYVVDTQADELPLTFWYRIVPYRSYEGLEDRPEPFRESGPGDDLARQIDGGRKNQEMPNGRKTWNSYGVPPPG
jgi:hypothetical protein